MQRSIRLAANVRWCLRGLFTAIGNETDSMSAFTLTSINSIIGVKRSTAGAYCRIPV